jgi:hypothetical protein
MSLITDTSDRPIEIDGITPGSPGGPPAAASRRTAPAVKPAAQPAPAPALRNGVDVDPDGADRARADEAAARAAGFSPKPPIYQIGTLVNEIGVENFKASRAAHDAKPLLAEAVEKLVSRVEAERRVDRRTAIPALRMHPSGMLGTAADGEAGKQRMIPLTERGLETLCAHVTPAGGRYLAQCPPELRAHNLNEWFPKGTKEVTRTDPKTKIETTTTEPREVTVRCRRRPDGTPEIFAVGGPRYTAYDVDKVAKSVANALKGVGDARAEITYDGYRATIDVLWHTNVQPSKAVAGEIFRVGLRVKAADDGSGGISVSLLLERNLCLNLIVIDFNKLLVGRRKHVGKVETIEAVVATYLDASAERLGHFVKAWDNGTAEDILERYDLQNVDEVIRGLVLNRVVWVAGVEPEAMQERLRRAWDKEPGYSRNAFINAITRCAHEEEWQRWSDVEDLESTAGELLFQKVWNCVPPVEIDPASLLDMT